MAVFRLFSAKITHRELASRCNIMHVSSLIWDFISRFHTFAMELESTLDDFFATSVSQDFKFESIVIIYIYILRTEV